MKGKLYLVATPIGNLEDITIRAINTLKNVDLIAAEDTRHTLKLLNHLNISKPLTSYYKEIEKQKREVIIDKILEGKKCCYRIGCWHSRHFRSRRGDSKACNRK